MSNSRIIEVHKYFDMLIVTDDPNQRCEIIVKLLIILVDLSTIPIQNSSQCIQTWLENGNFIEHYHRLSEVIKKTKCPNNRVIEFNKYINSDKTNIMNDICNIFSMWLKERHAIEALAMPCN